MSEALVGRTARSFCTLRGLRFLGALRIWPRPLRAGHTRLLDRPPGALPGQTHQRHALVSISTRRRSRAGHTLCVRRPRALPACPGTISPYFLKTGRICPYACQLRSNPVQLDQCLLDVDQTRPDVKQIRPFKTSFGPMLENFDRIGPNVARHSERFRPTSTGC